MKRIGVALVGLGNVGRAFARYAIEWAPGVQLRAACDKTGGLFLDSPEQVDALLDYKEKGGQVGDFARARVMNAAAFLQSLPLQGVSVLVESLPTNLADGQPALDLLRMALAQGTHVVTVDKGPLVHGFDVLEAAARSGAAELAYSGTTGVRPPAEVIGERVTEIRGVLNGTTNYILNEMQQRRVGFDEALRGAQAAGIAEPDVSLDTDGWDTAAKILILAKKLMGADTRLEEVSRIGISAVTEELIRTARARGAVVRLVGRARIWQGRVRVSVAPKISEAGSRFYELPGTAKRAVYRIASGSEFTVDGFSGRDSICRVILEDIESLAV